MNFAEFLAFRALSSPVLCRVPLLRVILVQARRAWGQSFLVAQNRMLGLGFGLLFVLNAGTAGTFLCLQ